MSSRLKAAIAKGKAKASAKRAATSKSSSATASTASMSTAPSASSSKAPSRTPSFPQPQPKAPKQASFKTKIAPASDKSSSSGAEEVGAGPGGHDAAVDSTTAERATASKESGADPAADVKESAADHAEEEDPLNDPDYVRGNVEFLNGSLRELLQESDASDLKRTLAKVEGEVLVDDFARSLLDWRSFLALRERFFGLDLVRRAALEGEENIFLTVVWVEQLWTRSMMLSASMGTVVVARLGGGDHVSYVIAS